jgi:hypothetical protein
MPLPTLQDVGPIQKYIGENPVGNLSDKDLKEEFHYWTRLIDVQWDDEQLRSEIKDPGDNFIECSGALLTILGFPILALNYIFATAVSLAGLVLFGLSRIEKSRDGKARIKTREAVRLADARRTALMNEASDRALKKTATSASITP